MRVLLAGVPFGCDNVGDEAILECAVEILKDAAPDAHLTVSTRDGARTSARLGVDTCGLLGFFGDVSPEETRRIMGGHDCFVWCGATGLSDYPQVTTRLMLLAQSLGMKTILWGCGMNDELTPAYHKVLPGRRRQLLSALGAATFGLIDFITLEERRRNRRSRQLIEKSLNRADLIVVRDERSRDEVLKCGVTRDVIVGADSAIYLKAADFGATGLSPGIRELVEQDIPKIGLCVSAQGSISQIQELASFLDKLAEIAPRSVVVAIPMNPKTDASLMAGLAAHLRFRDRFAVLTGEYLPSEILAVAARMDVVISSRLHLLILAASAGVPIVGIARGSKVDTFLEHFGLAPAGNVLECDFVALKENVLQVLEQPGEFRARSAQVLAESKGRLASAKQLLGEILGS